MTVKLFCKTLLTLCCLKIFTLSAQVDTVKESLKFDFGFTRSKNINLWPIYKQVNTQTYKEIDVLFPLFLKKKDESKSINYSHLAPIYFKSNTPAYKDFRLFSFYYPSVFHYRKDTNDVKSYRLLEILPRFSLMDIRKSRRGIYLDQNLLFFIWFKNDLILQQSHFVVFPFSWYYRNRENKSYTFFPLLSTGTSGENKFTVITPLFWHLKNNKRVSNTIFPLWFQRRSLDPEVKISSNVIFPVWWSSRDLNNTKRVLFPLYWEFKNDIFKYHTTTFFPLFSTGHSDNYKQKHLVITPLYWQYQNENEKNRILLPLWWKNVSYSRADTTVANIIFPVSWNFKSNKGHNYTFFPLFSYGNYYRHSWFAISPLFWHTENPKRSGNTLFPLFWQRKSKDTLVAGSTVVLFPLWWSHSFLDKRQKILLPFYWDFKTHLYHDITFFPFYSTGRSKDGLRKYFAITPFYWNRSHPFGHSRTIFPVFWNNTRYHGNDTLKTNIVFPLLWDFSSKSYHYSMLLPIYGSFRDKDYQSTTLMPLFSYGSSIDKRKDHLAITPFFWHINTPHSKTSLLLPVFYHRKGFYHSDTIRTTMAALLWWSVIKKKQDYLHVLFPLFWRIKNPTVSITTFFPLFYSNQTADQKLKVLRITPFFHSTLRDKVKSTVLFPVFWDKKSLDTANPFRESELFPFYWSMVHRDYKTTTLFPIIWSRITPLYRSFTFFPIISTGRSANGDKRHLVITPFFWHNRNINSSFSALLPLCWYKRTNINGIENRQSVFLPLWLSQQTGNEKAKVLFPLLWYFRDTNYTSFILAPLFYNRKSLDGTYGSMMITPLIWRKTGINSVKFTFFPLFWYKRSDQLKYHSLLPFYFYSSSPDTRNFQFLLLVYNYRKNKDQSVYNGILWKTVYWNKFADGGHEFRFLYLLFARVEKKDLVEKSYFPVYYYSKVRNTDITRAWLLYFYSRSTHYIPEIKDYYIEERIFWFLRIRSNYSQLEKQGKAAYIKHRRHPKTEMPSGKF